MTRTAWLNRDATIWSNHINAVAERAGLDSDESRAMIVQGPDAPGWSEWDRTVLRAADDLYQYRMITDTTWNALAEQYTEGQLFEVLMTVGHYNTINMWFNTVGIQPGEPFHPMPADPDGQGRVAGSMPEARRVEAYPRLYSSGRQPRFPPLLRSQMTPRQIEIIDWATPGGGSGEGNIQVRFCLYHPEMCRAYWDLTDQLRVRYATIPIRDHELAIQRTAWLTRGESIWSNHLNAVSPIANLNDEESIAGIIQGPDAPIWTDWERTILRAADELHMYRFITEPTWQALDAVYDEGQLTELIMTIGNYVNVIGFFESVGNAPHDPVNPMSPDPTQ